MCKAIDAYGLSGQLVIYNLRGVVSTKGVLENWRATLPAFFGMFRFGHGAWLGVGQCYHEGFFCIAAASCMACSLF